MDFCDVSSYLWCPRSQQISPVMEQYSRTRLPSKARLTVTLQRLYLPRLVAGPAGKTMPHTMDAHSPIVWTKALRISSVPIFSMAVSQIHPNGSSRLCFGSSPMTPHHPKVQQPTVHLLFLFGKLLLLWIFLRATLLPFKKLLRLPPIARRRSHHSRAI